jgi:hypothetical protein
MMWIHERGASARLAESRIVSGAAILLATLALAAAAEAGTLTVTSTADGGSGSLRDTVAAANGGDTIVFAVSGTIVLTGGEIALGKDLDIEGPGAAVLSISGNNRSRIFDIFVGGTTASAPVVTVAGLTLTEGRAGGTGGGAILNVGATLNLRSAVISNSVASFGGATEFVPGGGISLQKGAFLTATDTLFTGNTAAVVGANGCNGAEGGAICNWASTATVTRCTFIGNQALGGSGGELDGEGNPWHDIALGGAIFNGHTFGSLAASLTVIDCTFSGNLAIGGSGASAGNIKLAHAEFYLLGLAAGGAIANHDIGALTVDASTFEGNACVGGSNNTGAAVKFGFLGTAFGGALLNHGTATVTGSTFASNTATGGDDNTAPLDGLSGVGWGNGGAIATMHAGQGILVLDDCTFADNQAAGGDGNAGGTFPGDGRGGALFNWVGGMATVNGCSLAGGKAVGGLGASGLGGGIYNDGPSTLPANAGAPTKLALCGTAVTDNSAIAGGAGGGAGGGGIYLLAGGLACADSFTIANTSGNTPDDVSGSWSSSSCSCP